MYRFKVIDAKTVDEAVSSLSEHGSSAIAIAGGTDAIEQLVKRSQPNQPEYVVFLGNIGDLDYITEDSQGLKIGALAKLHDIAFSSVVQSNYPALAKAARVVASWQVRNMGTIAGNICQQTRCWYLRSSWNKFNCIRKGGGLCNATLGNNRFHSIFGGVEGCVAVNPSDTAPVLVALGAKIQTTSRTLDADGFFDGFNNTMLANDEIITEIQIPAPADGSKQVYEKVSIRKAIDFALVSAAIYVAPATGTITDAKMVLGSVAPVPMRATKAEEALVGNSLSEAVAETAAAAAVDGAIVLPYNKYKVAMLEGVVKRALLA
jgi:xanthine dehydrogenase YagS FAD-binding subunit